MRRKAEAGDGEAMCNLGVCYENGELGLAKDKAKAFEWYEKSHEAGYATGTGNLGRCYLYGLGVQRAPCVVPCCWARPPDAAAKTRATIWDAHTLLASGTSRRTRRWRAATSRWWRAPRSRIAPTLAKRKQPHGCVSIQQLDLALECLSAALGFSVAGLPQTSPTNMLSSTLGSTGGSVCGMRHVPVSSCVSRGVSKSVLKGP